MENEIKCALCGETTGPFTKVEDGDWHCLSHLPRLGFVPGRRVNRDRALAR